MGFSRALAALFRCSPWTLLCPHVYAVGNAAEQIYFGLLKARRDGKKLLLLVPFELPWKLRFRLTNRALFSIESPHRVFGARHPVTLLGRLALTLFYLPLRALNLVVRRVFGGGFDDRWTYPFLGSETLWQPPGTAGSFSWECVAALDWERQLNAPLPVSLPESDEARATSLRRELGLPDDAWFACLHVREGGFHNDHASSACRNADILNYIPAIKTITARGGWVIRMGDSTMKPLPRLKRVIDYPHTSLKSDLLDMHLLRECRFFFGLPSGIMDAALLFQKPMLLANMHIWTFAYPPREGDLGLIKHVYSKSRNRFLSLQELLEEPWEAQYFLRLGADYEMYENSPEEILAMVEEFLQSPRSDVSEGQRRFNHGRVLQGRKILSTAILSDPFSDILNRYRIASRLESSRGSLCAAFVAENWERNSREAASRRS
ncbi:MAG: hypothetical protein AUJ52_12485 [Elusimicrobia bacterium CG1_02_63_36]|nr:MAG: hypothetical protein AUJ52_12485 [Elusimicrobia bacterium CG1_02_63_36]PIP83011.1 MAG: hypothetical protein COR54_11940 [Elusimicrobia bacterium CG22_combo_CG10-13_8_21_14_all_63_91]PJA17504.1 MAG: hypothetical protein COX66_04470 [Elusimicrobia bacterium CG_4_10_14_0_2_um_filter_63_34]PJB25424.1 MAG: hypothetical protein CO113_08490 [Elusimicrobia bacterium CG_4_9_14_3_um_filter_62_55]